MSHPTNCVAEVLCKWQSPVTWDILRDMEEARESVRLDPSNLHNDMVAMAKSLNPVLIGTLTLMGLRALTEIKTGCVSQQSYMDYLDRNRDNLHYFKSKVDDSQWSELVELTKKVHPWFFFLMYTDPSI